MNYIEPNIEIWEQECNPNNLMLGIWAHIARCVRVCYQSETKKNPSESDEAFVRRVIMAHKPENSEANHLAMLEHGTIYLTIPADSYNEHEITQRYKYNKYSKLLFRPKATYITTNFRVLVENNWLDDLEYISTSTEFHEKRITVCFTTDLGVSREFNRHRVNSIAEESTRYCNYNKKNNGEINYSLSAWFNEADKEYLIDNQYNFYTDYIIDIYNTDGNDELDEEWSDLDYYMFALRTCEFCYNGLIRKGWKAQMARQVLPLATKTQLVHTAFVSDWIHFLKLRAIGISGAPHPNARLVAQPLLNEFVNKGIINPNSVI